MIWLGPNRGYLNDWVTQQWVKATGRTVDLATCDWLSGPVGKPTGIGSRFFDEYAAENGLIVVPGAGLISDFSILTANHPHADQLCPSVVDFYQHTAEYELEAWSQWSGLFRPFGWLLALMFSRRLQQLNIPLSALDTSRGVTSTVINLKDKNTGQVLYTAWLRQLLRNSNVLYAGAYSTCVVPGFAGQCIKVVFPLPNGNAIVIMYPETRDDGSLVITSAGRRFGDPGFYFTVHGAARVWVRYVRAMQESIHVYDAGSGEVRADHVLRFFGMQFLRLHYRLRKQTGSLPRAASSSQSS